MPDKREGERKRMRNRCRKQWVRGEGLQKAYLGVQLQGQSKTACLKEFTVLQG